MTETRDVNAAARRVGDRSAEWLQRFGLSRLVGGIILVVLGFLILALPALVVWLVGIGAIVLGILVLAYAPGRDGTT